VQQLLYFTLTDNTFDSISFVQLLTTYRTKVQ